MAEKTNMMTSHSMTPLSAKIHDPGGVYKNLPLDITHDNARRQGQQYRVARRIKIPLSLPLPGLLNIFPGIRYLAVCLSNINIHFTDPISRR